MVKTFEEFKFVDKILYRNIPEKYKEVYKSIKNIFKGSVFVKYIHQRKWGNDEPSDIILVGGKDDYKSIYMNRKGFEPRKWDGSARFEFNLTKDFDDILKWIEGNEPLIKISKIDPLGEEDWEDKHKPKEDQFQDFLTHFDAYQGEGAILPTKDKPYTFYDVD